MVSLIAKNRSLDTERRYHSLRDTLGCFEKVDMPNRPSKGKERKQAPASRRPQQSDDTARKKAQQLQSTFSRTQDSVGFDAERPFDRPIKEELCVLSNDACQPAGRPVLSIPRRPKWRRDRMSSHLRVLGSSHLT